MSVQIIPGSVIANLKKIKGKDNKINTRIEAKAILEYIPKADVRCAEDEIRLYSAYQEAQRYLKDKSSDSKISWNNLCHKVINKGNNFLTKINKRIEKWYN